MNPEQRRVIEHAEERDELLLWRSLAPLRSINAFMQTGAHPDDESSALLARLALGDGAHVAYACAVRGEGGQNELGTESGAALGALRSAEMRQASRTLGVDLYWLNTEPDGSLRDFRFSKSPEETLARWGGERLAERLVRAIRMHRPDAIMPSFLDVPGQHGHHRAVTRATIAAFRQAGDPAVFREHARDGLAPWQPAKLYLPSWSGAGQSYDDTEPPPPATLTIEVGEVDPVFGASYAQIGEWSRVNHLSQGMGVWIDDGPRAVGLHRLACAITPAPEAERAIFDGLPRTLGDLAERIGDQAVARHLHAAHRAIAAAITAFPERREIARAVHAALGALRGAQAALPGRLAANVAADVDRRIAVKLRQLARASREAVELVAHCRPASAELAPGGTISVSVSAVARLDDVTGLTIRLVAADGLVLTRSDARTTTVTAPTDAGFTHPYRFTEVLGEPNTPLHAAISYAVDDASVEVTEDVQLAVVPAAPLTVEPAALAWNLAGGRDSFTLTASESAGKRLSLAVPAGWRVTAPSVDGAVKTRFTVTPPADPGDGPVTLRFMVDDAPAHCMTRIAYPHIGTQRLVTPAIATIRAMRVALPRARIGYVDGGADRAWQRLQQIGLDVDLLSAEMVAGGDFGRFDTIVVGVFAYRTRPELAAANARIKAWMQAGGTLLTLYHRPWDNWDPDRVPPLRLQIGQPSLRWRVTDENSSVTYLIRDHPLLNTPNPIGPADWQGWDKERGLYFASSWAEPYEALLEMGDPGETPLRGALLSARVGKGRHTHTSLNLHHQLDALTPGAYRLFANLVAKAGV
jgi:LmbE family N-acetylglucosaminyl deacetylase